MSAFVPFPTRFTTEDKNASSPPALAKAAKPAKPTSDFSDLSSFSDTEWEDPDFWPGDAPRARQVRSLLAELSQEVSQHAPAGIGLWPPLGDIVDPPANRLFDGCTDYVEGRVDDEKLLRAVREVRHSWWLAAALYRQVMPEYGPTD